MRYSAAGEQIQVRPDGPWHSRERIDGGARTSCGQAIIVYSSRYGGYDDLCPVCFTEEEIKTGEIERLKREHADETGDLYHDPDEEPTDPNGHPEPDRGDDD